MPDPDTRQGVYVGLTAYRWLTRETYLCMIRDLLPLQQRFALVMGDIGGDALISRSRSRMMSNWLDGTSAEVLMWIDADIVWLGADGDYPGDIPRLVETCTRTKGIVGGVYSKRNFSEGIPIRFDGFRGQMSTGTDQVIDCEYVSSGFMAVHRSAAERIAKTLTYVHGGWMPFCEPCVVKEKDGSQLYLSEDWALCRRAKDLDIPVHVDARPILRHVGDYAYTVADAFKNVAGAEVSNVH